MDWMTALANAIAIFRLCLIFCGLWLLFRSATKRNVLDDTQKKYFAISGIIYLLGLMPQSLLLLLINSDVIGFLLDNGYLCWTQKLACMISVFLHTLIVIHWITSLMPSHTADGANCATKFLKLKCFTYIVLLYVTILILCRAFILRNDDGKRLYTDIATRSENNSWWTIIKEDKTSQAIRLQLLLCESTLPEEEIQEYLIICYSILILPLVLLCSALKSITQNVKHFSKLDNIKEIQTTEKGWQHYSWWEQENNVQRFLSTSITVWYNVIQPIIFAYHSHHFVDFGTHLLLTVCVFLPWTFSEKEIQSSQSWV